MSLEQTNNVVRTQALTFKAITIIIAFKKAFKEKLGFDLCDNVKKLLKK